MTVEEYFNKAKWHDWYYMMSDDQRYYTAGLLSLGELVRAKAENPIFAKIFEAFENYHFSGKAYGSPKAPEPKLEDFTCLQA